ncbi:MAG: NUDIX hydrolase [Deltaproteobacteria bacterium]|nr:NUDIX hydrolase [Deltaproteobacteria bacterium]
MIKKEGPMGPRLAVDVILDDRQRGVLLVKRRNPPLGWALPGGFVEYGESLETSAAREMLEETGLEVSGLKLFGVYSDPGRDPRGHCVSVVFTALADAPEATPCGGDDAAEARFFQWENLPPLAFDHSLILADYQNSRPPEISG